MGQALKSRLLNYNERQWPSIYSGNNQSSCFVKEDKKGIRKGRNAKEKKKKANHQKGSLPRISKKMLSKRRSMNKKGGILEISGLVLVFSFISIIYIFIAVFMFATSNDYLFYNLQNMTETLEEQGIIKNGTSAQTQIYGEEYQNFNFHLDDLWFIAYLFFIISSLIVSYRAERHNYFSFLGLLFYGLMFILFLLTIFSTITTWFKDNILTVIIPTASIVVPKFYYYLDNIGIFSAIHLVVCLFVNMIDLDLAKIFQKKKQEELVMQDEEVV